MLLKSMIRLHEADTGTEGGNAGVEPEKTYTQAEVDSLTDKKVDKAIQTALAKQQEEFASKLETEKEEAAKYAKMTAEQKKSAEMEKREQEIAERETKIALQELHGEVVADLNEQGLPIELADVFTVNGVDTETIKGAIEKVSETIKTQIAEGIKAGARQSAPKSGVNLGSKENNTSLAERASKARII
ncbi:DUF4355 domain-containing protein [Periweissella cryptocerci]|uniref:DUF4355 domain-containing protein n=1 Tax=Periweissella cryptocerci TaxID=2506420 RepID=A0A4P6YRY1_9LACO|nr:DUF4355 domain-containing protein [Periweissella cryptocerci]QBO35386.1 DUF4355 domain-containing protein [Periweissella cryptocerci]